MCVSLPTAFFPEYINLPGCWSDEQSNVVATNTHCYRNCLAEEEFSSAGERAYPILSWQGNCVWFVPSTNPISVLRYKRLVPSLLSECSVGPNPRVSFKSQYVVWLLKCIHHCWKLVTWGMTWLGKTEGKGSRSERILPAFRTYLPSESRVCICAVVL
jgi:hypothetical protein